MNNIRTTDELKARLDEMKAEFDGLKKDAKLVLPEAIKSLKIKTPPNE